MPIQHAVYWLLERQPNHFDQQEGLVVADDGKAAGITSEIHRLTPRELRNGELRSTYAGVAYGRRGFDLERRVRVASEFTVTEGEKRAS